jgi:hypothetical protein
MRLSWTGFLIYEVTFEECAAALRATSARINRNPKQYGGTDDEYDTRMIAFLIEALLLGLPAPFPVQEELSPDQQAIAAWSVAGKAGFQ